MAADSAVPALPYPQEKLDKLPVIHGDFGFLANNKHKPFDSDYTYCQAVFLEDLNESWPVVEGLCQCLKIPLTVTLAEVESIFYGFDAATIAKLYANPLYAGLSWKKISAMEEDRLLHLTRSVLDKLMARLQKNFKKAQAKIPPQNHSDDGIATESAENGDLSGHAEAAYQSYAYAESQLGCRVTDKQVYAYLKEHGPRDYDLPSFETWRRYVAAGRNFHTAQKNTPRSGRSGKSIVRLDQI
jgi:hypothetical protein